ncbi:hypothetical protein [Spirosoma sp. 48-14]|uniref:hypothetical protein n=1 Tax=Spirosoma sp. 48-14 TaxID=1895854 RepID=UPI00095A180A|nr:hypothetical protein [Spirosoma sp. 48-14]OJW73265.1 MAG: hypothetical protein BGO59_07235 [Spirosoma sp. 48-14]
MNQYADHSYEIIWITKPEHLQTHADLIESFFTLYEHPSNFPDPDEREDPQFIKERIAEDSNDPHTHLMAYVLTGPDGDKKFVAGCIVEFYPDSACGLVTYLFVDQNFRGVAIGSDHKKVAESIIQSEQGLPGLVKYFAREYGKSVNAVLFESNNPFDTLPENDSMPPAKRLKFFSRMGAKRINFNYIQPPLGDDKGIVTNLYLLCFPWLTGLSDSIPIATVISFVMELAKSLDRNKEADSLTRYGNENYLHDFEAVKQLNESAQIGIVKPILIGLTAEGRNIINEMYNDLTNQYTTNQSVALTPIPGINV